MKTPEQIADEVLARPYVGGFTNSGNPFNRRFEKALIVAGIEAERAQRRRQAFEALRRWDEKFEAEVGE